MGLPFLDQFLPGGLVWQILTLITVAVLLRFVSLIFYNVYLHPLRHYPGPFWHKVSRVPYLRAWITGRLAHEVRRLHDQYGSVVRIAPNELSFTSPGAWKDIYGHRAAGQPELEKYDKFYRSVGNPVEHIVIARREQHGRLRRLLSHGFSERALREQEPMIQQYIDLLIKRLNEQCGSKEGKKQTSDPLDMVLWYNWTTFDLIGDLAFGEPFGCLESSTYHPWVSMIFSMVKVGAIFQAAAYYPILKYIIYFSIPKSLMARRNAHNQMTREKVLRRIEANHDRPDFFSNILQNKDELGITVRELSANGNILILAGSETTATLLAGATYLLLMNPHTMKKLEEEICSTFKSEKDIDVLSVNRLTYMLACLDESLRMYPPTPTGLPRVTPKGGCNINDEFVPEDTTVSIHHWSINHDAMNFNQPWDFIPERFLGDPHFASDRKDALNPFSVGPRNCLGRNLAYTEMRLILARVIYNFRMELDGESKDWIERQKIYGLWEKVPLKVRLTPRWQ